MGLARIDVMLDLLVEEVCEAQAGRGRIEAIDIDIYTDVHVSGCVGVPGKVPVPA